MNSMNASQDRAGVNLPSYMVNRIQAKQDQIAKSMEIVLRYDQQLQLASQNLINREKMSLVTRLAEIAYTRGEMTWTTAIDFYMGKSRDELRSIMRTVKGIFHLSHMQLTNNTINQLSNWMKTVDFTFWEAL